MRRKEKEYLYMTKNKMDEYNKFIEILKRLNKKIWIRQVIVPGINDNKEYILDLKEYLKQFKNIEKIELLPYHLYGVEKYKTLGIDYPLDGVPPMDEVKLESLRKLL